MGHSKKIVCKNIEKFDNGGMVGKESPKHLAIDRSQFSDDGRDLHNLLRRHSNRLIANGLPRAAGLSQARTTPELFCLSNAPASEVPDTQVQSHRGMAATFSVFASALSVSELISVNRVRKGEPFVQRPIYLRVAFPDREMPFAGLFPCDDDPPSPRLSDPKITRTVNDIVGQLHDTQRLRPSLFQDGMPQILRAYGVPPPESV